MNKDTSCYCFCTLGILQQAIYGSKGYQCSQILERSIHSLIFQAILEALGHYAPSCACFI